ncbi:gliding motility-associated C-terminal domain-containing protein [uncultured Aquimarina sp.]|uniref:T9SS type B sorting domain-containing protein n=1 Tax=uncultured Aquimarina sp. TaxID=575652 RepID=UPI002615A555|nr:gliding motility-associated C-terminal domain-containing protein [uncultured Aquimarina sp.]
MKKRLNLTIVAIFLALGIHVAKAQRNIGAPSLTSGAQACGTLSNSFDFVARLSPGTALPTNNEFILELSDPTGSFANQADIEELDRVLGPNEASGAESNINFTNVTVPQNANSDDYRLRVRATEGNVTNTISEPIPFHFFDDDNLLIRLNSGDDVIFCNVASFAKEISVEVTDGATVLDVNDFNWEWLKDGTIIPGESNPTLLVTEEGTYQARVPVGLCNNVFRFNKSNRVDASLVNVGDISIVTNASDFSFCPDELKELRASEIDFSYDYQWFKDDEALEGEIGPTIILPDNDFGGEYVLQISLSEDCSDLQTQAVVVTNEGSSITLPLPEGLILLPTQILTLVVETDAPVGSTFRWIRDTNILIQGITTGSTITFDVPANGVGDYRVEIDALFPDDPCMTMLFSETKIRSAERFDIIIAPEGVVDCEQDPITISLTEMVGITSDGERVPLTTEQFAFFAFEWFNDGVSTGETSLSLDVSRSDSGGSFELRAIFGPGGLPNTVSNNLPIDFLSSDIVLDITPPILQVGESVVLTAPFNDNFTYEWYVIINGEEVLIENEIGNTLTVTEEGNYFARISTSLCTVDTITASVGGPEALSELIPNVITPGGNVSNNDWVLPNSFRETDVEVTIYSSNGKVDFQKNGGYNADWPTNSASQANELIYYYIISRSSTVVKKGTITVMR